MNTKRILFVTWDGPDVNYLETLFVPIFKSLQEEYAYEFHILQFIWGADELILKRKKDFSHKGIAYRAVKVSPKFPMLSMLKGKYIDTLSIKTYINKYQIDTIMPRSTTSLALVTSLVKKLNLKLIFDADGFSQDERVDFSGLSPLSLRYRIYRDIELQGYHLAKAIICRSNKAKAIIDNRAGAGFDAHKSFVVHNGTFVKLNGDNKKKDQTCNIVYSGSIGPQYRVLEMVEIFKLIKNTLPYATLTFLTLQVEKVRELLRIDFTELEPDIIVKKVAANEVSRELGQYDIGISLRQETLSMQGVAPIKVSEYAGAGLSIIYSPGIGDMEELMKNKPFAYCYRELSEEGNLRLTDWVQAQIQTDYSTDVRDFANEAFSLSKTIEIYHHALQY